MAGVGGSNGGGARQRGAAIGAILERLDASARKFYLPGETVKGTIHADYFFGKPVDGGKVNVKLAKFDVGFNDFAEITGDTDASGTFEFEQKLPDAFAGQPLEQGDAFFKAEVKVTDGADHTETVTAMVPVAKDPIKILVVPEGGQLEILVEHLGGPGGSAANWRVILQGSGFGC
mgnify:CR=1 FL=1